MKLYPHLVSIKDYAPKSRMFTSSEEIRYISDQLELDRATDDDLYNYRTLVVSLWTERSRNEDDPARSASIFNAMQSITTVLDCKMLDRGLDI